LASIKREPARLEELLRVEPRLQQFAAVALEYRRLERMRPEERDAFLKKQGEQMEVLARREEEEAERRRQDEKRRKEEAAERERAEADARLSPQQRAAKVRKEAGNAAFKARQWDEALRCYEEAAALDPLDITFLNNQAAVALEKGDTDSCLRLSQRAVELGREQRAPFAAIGRALQRMGSAHLRRGDHEAAVDAFRKSLTEDRTSETLALLRKAEKALEEAARLAYRNPELSAAAKEEGNAHFKAGRFPEAIERYTEAIKRLPDDPALYSNRATAYTKLLALPEALRDLETSLTLKPVGNVKAHLKKGRVHELLKEYQKALACYEAVLTEEPENGEASAAMVQCIRLAQSAQGDPEAIARNVERDPALQATLRDPAVQQLLRELKRDPTAASAAIERDPELAAKVEKLVAAGVLR
jgi:stress-induced-phosphoprotein 1